MKEILFALEVWGTDYEKIKQTCLSAEELGYDGFYYGESLSDIDLDCWTVLSSLASLTDRIKFGPVITYLFPNYRSIALVAKQAITLQNVSKGRLDFRTGAGATFQYANSWWYPYGLEYFDAAKRVMIFKEGISVLTRLIGNYHTSDSESIFSPVYHKGDFFVLNGANFKKPEKKIPITIAAKKDIMMKIASQYADVWEVSYMSPEGFSLANKRFEELSNLNKGEDKKVEKVEKVGGNGNSNEVQRKIKRSIELDVLIADSQSELEYKKKLFTMERGISMYNQILENGLVGTPDIVLKRVKEYVSAGVDQFFLAFQDPFDTKAIDLFIKTCKI